MGRIDCAVLDLTSCARGDTICLRPCKLTISSYLFARWHLFQHIGCLRHQQHVDLQPFDLGSGVRVTCDVGYLCANFSLPCSRVRPNVRDRHTDRQTDGRQTKASLNASALWGRRHNNVSHFVGRGDPDVRGPPHRCASVATSMLLISLFVI